jgi:hypothetical protein
MMDRLHIEQELRAAGSQLPAGLTVLPYAVPAGFFEAFPGRLLARVKVLETPSAELEELSPFLASLPKSMPFEVPAGFFESLAQPEEAFPEILATHDRAMPYGVPAGYFETLPESLLAAARPAARVVPMFRRGVFRTAAAAVVAGAIAIGGWLYSGSNSTATVAPGASTEAWVQKRLNNVPDQALDEFIENTDPVHSGDLASTAGTQKPEVSKMLKDVSESEMDAFLDQVPTDDEALTVIN